MSDSDSFRLAKKPLSIADIPSEDTILACAKEILASIPQWKEGKVHGDVKTFTLPKYLTPGTSPEDFWACRVSEHPPSQASFDVMWERLGKNKAENEMKYMPIIRKVTKVKEISLSQQIWTLYYKISAVLSPRVFTVLQVDHLDATDASRRVGTIISIPIDLSSDPELAKLEEKGVKGHYVSVEQLVELESGTVRWTMATASTPGGVIPDAVTNASLPGEIAKDVPQFMKWLQQETR